MEMEILEEKEEEEEVKSEEKEEVVQGLRGEEGEKVGEGTRRGRKMERKIGRRAKKSKDERQAVVAVSRFTSTEQEVHYYRSALLPS